MRTTFIALQLAVCLGMVLGQPQRQAVPRVDQLSPEQRRELRAQQEFRKAVAEANRQRAHHPHENNNFVGHRAQAIDESSVRALSAGFQPSAQQQQQQLQQQQQQQRSADEFLIQVGPSPASSSASAPSPSSAQAALQLGQEKQRLRQHRVRPEAQSPLRGLASELDEELFREQAENAKYSFESAVSDTINDHSHVRQETRDGLNLSGMYSYTDGFYKRTVHYVADQNGYRVVKEDTEPIGLGPKIDPEGRVDVSTNIGGNSLQYSITARDIPSLIEQRQELHQRKLQ